MRWITIRGILISASQEYPLFQHGDSCLRKAKNSGSHRRSVGTIPIWTLITIQLQHIRHSTFVSSPCFQYSHTTSRAVFLFRHHVQTPGHSLGIIRPINELKSRLQQISLLALTNDVRVPAVRRTTLITRQGLPLQLPGSYK